MMEKYEYYFIRRATVERRSPVPRRCNDETSLKMRGTRSDRRVNTDPRKEREDRTGWERVTLWASSPLHADS